MYQIDGLTEQKVKADLLTPPGGFLIWIFVFIELIVFGAVLVYFSYQKGLSPELFTASQKQLSLGHGLMNTLLLITSGYCIAEATRCYDGDRRQPAARWVAGAWLLGGGFMVIKWQEYGKKIAEGIHFSTNPFFGYYWLITLFHAVHVLLGLFFLAVLFYKLYTDRPFAEEDAGVHTIAVYWHMCDLIWVLVFPILYIL